MILWFENISVFRFVQEIYQTTHIEKLINEYSSSLRFSSFFGFFLQLHMFVFMSNLKDLKKTYIPIIKSNVIVIFVHCYNHGEHNCFSSMTKETQSDISNLF